jgi:hypothetical protein
MTEAENKSPEDTIGDNNNFTPKQDKRWDELEAAEERDQNRQNSDGTRQLDEQKFAPYFAAANKKIDELVSDAHQKKDNIDNELDKSIKEVVQNLASTLKTLEFPVNRIANEIVHQLKGRGGSRSWILEVLSDEYKDKTHQENARKRKRKVAPVAEQQKQDLTTSSSHGHEVATVAPVAERNQQIMLGVGGHETTDTGAGDLPMYSPLSKQEITIIEDSAAKESPQQDRAYHLRILIDRDELSDKMAELHYKDIKNFWLCGRIENGKLLDMVLEKAQ